MLTLEIAGQTLKYKNAPDLDRKARELLADLQSRRAALDNESKEIRDQERSLQRFLGGKSARGVPSAAGLENGGL
jgi:hypothetical protein